jgi:hypothetical protein
MGRLYDYHDALDRAERLCDWYESDPDVEEVELPDINRCLPEIIKRRALSDRTAIAMVARIKDPTARELMELALELDRVSRRSIRPQVGEGGSGASRPNSRAATRAAPRRRAGRLPGTGTQSRDSVAGPTPSIVLLRRASH